MNSLKKLLVATFAVSILLPSTGCIITTRRHRIHHRRHRRPRRRRVRRRVELPNKKGRVLSNIG